MFAPIPLKRVMGAFVKYNRGFLWNYSYMITSEHYSLKWNGCNEIYFSWNEWKIKRCNLLEGVGLAFTSAHDLVTADGYRPDRIC